MRNWLLRITAIAPASESALAWLTNVMTLGGLALSIGMLVDEATVSIENIHVQMEHTKSLARALAPRVRVLSISPGLVDTEFVKSLDPKWRDEQASRTPLGRLATPEEVGQAIVAAVRHLTFSTGSIVLVDGGRLLS